MTGNLAIEQDIAGCLADTAGPAGLTAAELAPLLATCRATRDRLRRGLDRGGLRALDLARTTDDLPPLAELAADWRGRFRRVVLLGVGGSSLGARALAALPAAAGPELVVPDNLDPALMSAVLAPECLEETAFLVVSKSGGTAETLAQAIAALTALGDNLDNDGLAERFVMISEPGDGALRRLADGIGARVLPHDPDVGGRFSVLSLVGLLPALLLGLDAAAVRRGAREVLEAALDADDIATAGPAIGAAVNVGLLRHRGINQAVLLAYAEALRPFALWYRQLWAESLGKNGHGTTPIDALGPVDQHSQLQMYLEGPSDKLFTVLTLDPADQGPAIDRAMAEQLGLDYMAGRRIGDLVAAMQRATADALACRGRPVRRLGATALDERTLGALFMHFLLETVFAADLFGVDPFGQPAVESGKQRARDYLREAAP